MAQKKRIQVLSASIKGALHQMKNLPCQDFCASKMSNGRLIAVVSDGAGSARYSKIGARTICNTLCDTLTRSTHQNIKQDIMQAIENARQKLIWHRLNKSKTEKDLINFSATVVGAFYYQGKGLFFHIGDGACIAFKQGCYDNFIISEPANGAFSCETFFYTMSDWQDCLRFTDFTDVDRFTLMTDGVTGFVFSDDFYQIRQQFFIPIAEYLEQEKRKTYAAKALYNTLNDSKAQRLNADDKTILWAKL